MKDKQFKKNYGNNHNQAEPAKEQKCECGCGCSGCKCCESLKAFLSCKACWAKVLAAVVVLGLLAWGACCLCCHHCVKPSKVAVVDVNAIVANSKQVQALKNEQVAKSQELAAWLQEAEKALEAEKDPKKKEAMLKQYNAEFAAKKEDNNQYYAKQLHALDISITQTIVNEAKKQGYNVVLAKSNVIYGANDITIDVIKLVK